LQTKVVENIKTHILFSITFFFTENRAVYAITWKNIVDPERLQIAIWRMRVVCCIPKATNIRSEYVILLSHCNVGYSKAPHFYFTHTLPVLLRISKLAAIISLHSTNWLNFITEKVTVRYELNL
jgi:hypothetical protein